MAGTAQRKGGGVAGQGDREGTDGLRASLKRGRTDHALASTAPVECDDPTGARSCQAADAAAT